MRTTSNHFSASALTHIGSNGVTLSQTVGGGGAPESFIRASSLDPRITFSRTSLATMYDSTGRLTYAPNNIWLNSEAANAGFDLISSGVVLTTGIVDPLGGTKAIRVDFGGGNRAVSSFFNPLPAGNKIQSVWIKGDTAGTASFGAISGGSWPDTTVPVTTGWTRVNSSVFTTSTAESPGLVKRVGDLDRIYLAFPQVEVVTYETTPRAYNPTTASAYHGPRFDHNPATLAPLGLLIEEARTNLALRSQEFNNAAWNAANITVTANTQIAPDGTTTADTADATAVGDLIRQDITVVPNTVYTFSFWAKRGTATDLKYSVFDQTGVVNIIAPTTYYSQTNSSTWARISVTFTTPAGCVLASIYPLRDTGATGTSFLWGAQLEAGAFATSYIPTVAATVTRATDSASITGTNFSSWYNQSEGTFVIEGDTAVTGFARPISVNNGTDAHRYLTQFWAVQHLYVEAGGVVQVDLDAGDAPTGILAKVVFAYKANDFGSSLNGGATVTDTLGALPTVNKMDIGSHLGNQTILNGHIKSLQYYATRKSNVELQGLSLIRGTMDAMGNAYTTPLDVRSEANTNYTVPAAVLSANGTSYTPV